MKNMLHIGTIELVSLPDDQIQDVPAKIDTGADSSAIWASNIRLEQGRLSFNFFAPGSAYYREQPVVTTAFKTTSVKNSFGHEEFRYKIRLHIQLGENTLTRWFSLADRSRSTYPILLGKNVLHKRFIVDVSQKYLLSQGSGKQTVLVLGSRQNDEFFQKVARRNSLDVSYDCDSYDSLAFYLDGLRTKVVSTTFDGKDVADYTLTYFKSHDQNLEFAGATALYLHFRGKPFLDHELRSFVSQSKLSQYTKLACYDLPLPPVICAQTAVLAKRYDEIVETLGSPFVLKEIHSDRGQNNYLVDKQADFKRLLKAADPQHIYLAQKYIPNDGFLRLYVLGHEVSLAIQRDPQQHSNPLKNHLNKPSGGSNAQKVEVADLPPEVCELAIKAAACLDRQVAGVDILQDKQTGAWYILEVNNGPQLRSGSYVDDKVGSIAEFFDKELKR